MSDKYIGSNFDDFLAEDGILEEIETIAVKKALAFQIAELMRTQKISKVQLARKLQTSRMVLDRLLDPENNSVTLRTMGKAAHSLGKHLRLTLE